MSEYSPTPQADKLINKSNSTCTVLEMIAERDRTYALCDVDVTTTTREDKEIKSKLNFRLLDAINYAPKKGRDKNLFRERYTREGF